MDKIERIRKEIERLKEELRKPDSTAYTEAYIIGATHTLNTISDFLDTLQKEPVSEELEEAAEMFIDSLIPTEVNPVTPFAAEYVFELLNKAIEFGANWQKKQDQKTIELAEDHAMLAGMEKMKEQMMEDATEGRVISYDGISFPVSNEIYKLGLEEGDKVKVIILKGE